MAPKLNSDGFITFLQTVKRDRSNNAEHRQIFKNSGVTAINCSDSKFIRMITRYKEKQTPVACLISDSKMEFRCFAEALASLRQSDLITLIGDPGPYLVYLT